MNVDNQANFVAIERERIRLEYGRRASLDSDLNAPWQAPAWFMLENRNRKAATMLKALGVFPKRGDRCLEIGFGKIGWLSELIGWGIKETDLYGIELDHARAAQARELLPSANLRTGDAVKLEWNDETFRLVVASTVFSSILDLKVRRLIADEIVRVLRTDGALLWYDFAYNNPRNHNVRGIGWPQIRELFPTLRGKMKTVTLAPPLARFIAPRCWPLASVLEALPFLRTHLIAVLLKV